MAIELIVTSNIFKSKLIKSSCQFRTTPKYMKFEVANRKAHQYVELFVEKSKRGYVNEMRYGLRPRYYIGAYNIA